MKTITLHLDDTEHFLLKTACVEARTTIKAVLEEAIRTFIARENKKRSRTVVGPLKPVLEWEHE